MKRKLRIGVIFGGRSGEHEVSLASARSVLGALDRKKYEVIPIGIDKRGRWLSQGNALQFLESGKRSASEKIFLPDPRYQTLVSMAKRSGTPSAPLDCVIPLIHGTYGEDGSLQGLLELADIPYVGAGVLGSALGMDKVVQKQLFEREGLPITRYLHFTAYDWREDKTAIARSIKKRLHFPLFVKPANLGSSVGISKVQSLKQLAPAVIHALRYDRKIIVEQGIVHAREIECAVLGNERPRASVPGELVPKGSFYDYRAKYLSDDTEERVPAPLKAITKRRVRDVALQAFAALDGSGMARVDFFVSQDEKRIWLNEVNTIPGFTPISMYPKLWAASGLPYPRLLDELIRLGRERHAEKRRLTRTYTLSARPNV